MDFDSLVKNTRSCRRFKPEPAIKIDLLKSLVDLARITASAANLQPLKYILCSNPEKNISIFECLGWAGYLKDWAGPSPEERPTGYIVMLGDKRIAKNFDIDVGIASQTIMLGAKNMGYSGCMIGNIHHQKLAEVIKLKDHHVILLVLALGAPKENIVLESMKADDDFRYYRDEQGIHHVPKRNLDDIIKII